MGPRISQKSGSHLKIMCVKRVTRSKLRTEYEAPPGRLGARHYVSLLCTADLTVRATLLYQLNHIITLAISNHGVQKQNARTYSVLLGLRRLRKRHRSCFLFSVTAIPFRVSVMIPSASSETCTLAL